MRTLTAGERDAAYTALPEPVAALYRRLGTCPAAWVEPTGLSALTGLDVPTAGRMAESLVQAGLARTVDGGIGLDQDSHLHARLTADESDPKEHESDAAGLDRYFGFLNNAARAAEELITPSHRDLWERGTDVEPEALAPFPQGETAALVWLERQLPNYMTVIRYAYLEKRYALACDLAHRLWPLWLRRRHPEERYEALSLGLAAATALRHDRAIGQMLTTLAGAVRGTRPVEAYEYNRRALIHYQDCDDTLGLAQALNGLAKTLLSAGHLQVAEQYFRDAEQLRIDIGNTRGAALSRQGLGRVALAEGNAARAADLLISAYHVLMSERDTYDAALTLVFHAEALAALEDFDGALTELQSASATLSEANSLYGQALAWSAEARVLESAGRGDAAATAHNKALALRTQVKEGFVDAV